jgi:hypothetical protein
VPKSITIFGQITKSYFRIPSCELERFVSKKFLRRHNLELSDVRCKNSQESRNCRVRSTLTFVCRNGYVFSNKKGFVVSRCDSQGQWTSIASCVPKSRVNKLTTVPKKISLKVQKPIYKFIKGVPLIYYPPTCSLKKFVTRKFLRANNLRLIDLRCRNSWESKNCAVRSSMTFSCRDGYVFSNRKEFSVSKCNYLGQWTTISACVPGI